MLTFIFFFSVNNNSYSFCNSIYFDSLLFKASLSSIFSFSKFLFRSSIKLKSNNNLSCFVCTSVNFLFCSKYFFLLLSFSSSNILYLFFISLFSFNKESYWDFIFIKFNSTPFNFSANSLFSFMYFSLDIFSFLFSLSNNLHLFSNSLFIFIKF